MPTYCRRLPHIYNIGEPLFVTWRLAGSLPENRCFRTAELSSGAAFAVYDRLLDTARTGPLDLAEPAIARMAMAYLPRLAESDRLYDLHAFAVMPNHVHVLITPKADLPRILKVIKGGTARAANQILGATGRTFWQEEFYDHLVRNREEFRRIRNYIELNPVRAGLVTSPEEFPFSSAWRGAD